MWIEEKKIGKIGRVEPKKKKIKQREVFRERKKCNGDASMVADSVLEWMIAQNR